MEGYEIVCAIALGLLIDAVMAYVVWRWVLPMPTGRRRDVGTVRHPMFYDDANDSAPGIRVADAGLHSGTFDWTHPVSCDDWFTQGRTFNPATGLPMVDDTYDAVGNPYGVNLHEPFNHGCEDSGPDCFESGLDSFGASGICSGFDSFESGCFDTGSGGVHDW